MKTTELQNKLNNLKTRSALDKGIKEYAYMLLQVYDEDIARTLCTPSELKRTDNGRLPPNSHESWLGCQARAAWQAQRLLLLLF